MKLSIKTPFTWSNVVQLFQVQLDDTGLVRAQFDAFSKQIPLLYFILTINSMAVVYTYADLAPAWLAIYLPSALCVLCVWRGIWWLRARGLAFSDAAVIKHMRLTNTMAKILAIAFTVWGLSLYPYGDAFAKAHIAFYMAVTVVGCIFCLVHLRSAAFSVTALVGVPYVTFFLFVSRGALSAIAVNFGLVCVAMVAILMTNYRDFAQLVASRRALIAKQAETQAIANADALSGLPNRRALLTRLEEMRTGLGDDRQVAIVFIDLDGFKDVNDTYGHETGDELIRVLSQAFTRLLPTDAMLARLGGDEFAAIIPGQDVKSSALAFGKGILAHLMSPIAIGDRTIQSGASIGVACASSDDWSGQELFRRADIAMYHGKARGKGRIAVYDPGMDRDREAAQAMEAEIRLGLMHDEFDVYFQPVVDAATRQMVSVEALVRWPGRPGGAVGPDAFIAVAESSGLIHTLGLFVLRRACTAIKPFENVRLSVNISPAQFRDPAFEQKVGQVLAETGFPPQRLELELTEGYLIDHPERAQAAISGLKAMGMSVALDDFGTGYTSIAYLRRYGFNRIKIDKSLAGCIQEGSQEATLVAGTVFIANGLSMAVTAEGVETEEQATLLRLAGCQCLQGYLFSPAVDIATLQDLWLSEPPERNRLNARL